MDVIVRFAELDPYGHVNHARYLTYFESARIELLERIGFGMNTMLTQGYQIVLVELIAAFRAPAVLHDRLVIETTVGEIARSTTSWSQRALREDGIVATLLVKAAFTGLHGRPVRAPEGFSEAAFASG
jgi:acyl-CoA thioester hydrolase